MQLHKYKMQYYPSNATGGLVYLRISCTYTYTTPIVPHTAQGLWVALQPLVGLWVAPTFLHTTTRLKLLFTDSTLLYRTAQSTQNIF